jgi:hypothetical protein
MSYEDLEKAQAKHAMKEKANVTAGKGKHSRKHKNFALEAEPEAKVAQMSDVPEPATAPVAPWRAPVARMY